MGFHALFWLADVHTDRALTHKINKALKKSFQTSILKGVFPSAYCTQADQYLFIDVVRTIPQTQPHPPSFPECMLLTANATKRSVSYLPCICLRFMLHLHDLNHEEVNGLVLFPNGQDGVHYSLRENR